MEGHPLNTITRAALTACAVVAVAAVAAACGEVPVITSPTTHTAAATTAPAAVTTTAPTVAQQVRTWYYQDGGKAGLADFVKAANEASLAGNSGDLNAMQQACADFQSAVTAINSAGPVPYPPAEQWMAKAMANYSTGAAECLAGVQGQNASLLQSAAAAISAGNTDLGNATTAIKDA
jgi:hypothetical protein